MTATQVEADWLHQDDLRKMPAAGAAAAAVSREQDAAGGCDGVKNGRWGFHTEMEVDPWWQVDLQNVTAIDRVVLYNRCDLAERNSRIIVWLSDDGRSWLQAYQHDGTVFYGFTDKKPLVVPLAGVQVRYVRLGLRGRSYFHLDEVEVYPVGENRNVALGKPATQSSTSQWSAMHRRGGQTFCLSKESIHPCLSPARRNHGGTTWHESSSAGCACREPAEARGECRCAGEETARSGGGIGGASCSSFPSSSLGNAHPAKLCFACGATSEAELREDAFPSRAWERGGDRERELYMCAHQAVRQMALGNPLLDFDAILFVKAAPTRFPHMSDQFYGWWSRPGGGIFVLEGFKTDRPKVRCLTSGWEPGTFLRPDLSYDGRRVLFAYCKFYAHVPDLRNKASKTDVPEDAFFHVLRDGPRRRTDFQSVSRRTDFKSVQRRADFQSV